MTVSSKFLAVIAVVVGFVTLNVPIHAQSTTNGVKILGRTKLETAVRTVVALTSEEVDVRDLGKRFYQSTESNSDSERSSCLACGVLAGAVLGFAVHESGHLVANWTLRTGVYLKKVDGPGIPFFAIAHRNNLPRRQEFIVSSAGLWAQFATAEWILTRTPRLRSQRSSLSKGMLVFHVATSALYGIAGLGRVGPLERDTRGMAIGMGGDERWVGIAVLAPGVLDTYRYFYPSSTWARWASRASKIALLIPLLR